MMEVIAQIDAEITKLQQARALLAGSQPAKSGRGRPKGSKNSQPETKEATSSPAKKAKRKLTPEGRTAIAEAMKRRWAERRKTPSK